MKTLKAHSFDYLGLAAVAALTWLAAQPAVRANDWIAGVGDWSDAANWNGGVPANTVANVANGGTAIVSSAVPNVTEAWAGNGGVAGNIIVTNGGTLTVDYWLVVGRMWQSAAETPLSTLIVQNGTVIKNGNWGDSQFIVGDAFNGLRGLGQAILAGNGLVQINGGAFRIGVGNSQGALTIRDNAELRFAEGAPSWLGIGQEDGSAVVTLAGNATVNMRTCDFNVGDAGNGRGTVYLADNATVNVARFWVGKFGNTVGSLWQTGGAINGVGANNNEWCIGGDGGGDANSFGFYSLAGGTLTCPFNFQVGRYGKGILYQSGGTNTQSGWCCTARFVGSLGVTWISGGLFRHTGTGTRYLVAEQGRGEVTLSGSGVLDTTMPLMMAGGAAFLTLNGGTLSVPEIGKWAGGQAYLNLNGGTIRAKASNPNFFSSSLTEARVYAGHAIFDTAGNDITVSQQLLDGAGTGVLSVPVADPGAGYMGPPIVQITGDGFGALALAQIDPAAGTLTNIIVTCPGYGYTWAAVELIGGGASIPATPGTPAIGPVSGGGLIKNGAGTLTLTGANQYNGPTVVNEGRLVVTTDSVAAGAYSVGDGAALGVKPTFSGGQLTVASLALTGSTAALDFDLGTLGNPLAAPLNVSGSLTVNGTVTVNVAHDSPQLGQFPLLQYGSRSGAGSFVLGTLPRGVQATLVDNVANRTLDLNITSIGQPRWEGLAGGTWDIDTTTNWIELSTGLPTTYKDGAPVVFNDDALGTTTVNLLTTVQPAGVTVNNSSLDYTLVGNGKISGSQGLTKLGAATLTIANSAGNEYTGPTRVSGGTLVVTNLANGGQPSAIGKSSSAAANLVLSNATLRYAGPPVAIDRGYTIQGANSTIETLSDLALSGLTAATLGGGFVKAGPAGLTYFGPGTKELAGGATPGYNVANGTVIFDGTGGGQVNHCQGEFWVGGTPDTGASLILTNATLNVDSWFAVGRGNGTIGNLSTATLYDSALRCANFSMGFDANILGNLGHSVLTLNGSSTFTNNGDVNLAESGGSLAELFLNDNARFYSGGRMFVGWHNAATGMVTLARSASLTVNAWFSVGHEGGFGTVTLKDDSRLWVLWDLNITDVNTGEATLNIRDNATATANNFFIGKGVGSSGVVNQAGGAAIGLPSGNEYHIGFHGVGTWNLSGGSIVAPNHWFIVGRWADGPGTFNVSGGIVIHGTNDPGRLFRIGEDGTGVLNLSGTGEIQTSCNEVTIGWNATGDGTLNLNGGVFQARRIIGGSGASVVNFNGGVLRAGPNANADFLTALGSAHVRAGGAVIDTGANDIGIAQPLLDGGGNGGLTKLGTGALYLNGANTYTGPTLVNAGTLGGSGTISGPVTVGAAGTLAPGTSIGTLTINNNLTLAGTTVMEISKDGGVLAGDLAAVSGQLTFGGTLNVVLIGTNSLAVNDTFDLFNWGTQSGAFATINLPAGYTWDTSRLTVDGTIRVTAVQLPPPAVNPPVVAGGNLILTGTGGTPGGGYTWLTATNVAAPLAEWTTNTTGLFDGNGSFSNAIPISTTEPARFFRLRVP